jgi:beta-mannanase
VAVLLAAAGCSAAGAAGPNAAPGTPDDFADVALVPTGGIYLGAYYGDRSAEATDEAIGRTPQLNLTYYGWDDDWATSEDRQRDSDAGQISVVNWEPFDVEFDEIVAGVFDDMLISRATAAGSLDHPVFLDFAAEMNEEEGWGGHDPALYVAAYRHIHDVFARYDNGNTVWVWAPNNVDSADAPPALDYYPGADYVDWTGIDGYNWGTSDTDFEWQSFEQVFRPLYDVLHGLGKPIMIGETASAETGGSKRDWIADVVPTLQDDFPDIRAVIWFDVKKERDWRIRSSDAAGSEFGSMASNSYLGGE